MGNASTKEHHHGGHTPHQRSSSNDATGSGGRGSTSSSHSHLGQTLERMITPSRSSRHNNGRPNLEHALFGLGMAGGRDRGERGEEVYKSREERKAEKERERKAEREKERVRSMAEESVDGGYLVTVGVYTGPEDYSLKVVRQLQIERRLAPFWKGIPDHEDSWTDAQLVAAARGQPIPAPDAEVPASPTRPNMDHLDKLTVPIASRSRAHSYTSEMTPSSSSGNFSNSNQSLPTPVPAFATISRPRAKTFGMGRSSVSGPSGPVESSIPSNSVNGRPIEAVLYQHASECPICFLYYPPHLNRTRCCDQPICSECFVQIKRADPHVPEHSPPGSPRPQATENETSAPSDQLVSEPSSCPFCKETEFGIIYSPPPFKRGIVYVNQHHPYAAQYQSPLSQESVTSSTSSLAIGSPTSQTEWTRRKVSYAANAPEVITTDIIRPDWSAKLAHARNQAAKRAAAATALHTAAYMMGGLGGPSNNGAATISNRRLLRRQNGGTDGGGSSSASQREGNQSDADQQTVQRMERNGLLNARRNRMIDLEEMMLMEAIRLSLAEEEERKKREEKELKKNLKKKEKDDKKAAKAASPRGSFSRILHHNEPAYSSTATSGEPPSPINSKPGSSKFRAAASSSTSSIMETGSGSSSPRMSSNNILHGSDDEEEGVGTDPMFNFRSLAETLMDNEKGKENIHIDGSTVPDVQESENLESSMLTIKGKEPIVGRSDKESFQVDYSQSPSLDKGKNVAV